MAPNFHIRRTTIVIIDMVVNFGWYSFVAIEVHLFGFPYFISVLFPEKVLSIPLTCLNVVFLKRL